MEKDRIIGALVSIICIGLLALYAYGLRVKPFLTLAVPVSLAVLFILGLGIWLGVEMAKSYEVPEIKEEPKKKKKK